jgi:hypothetical protein
MHLSEAGFKPQCVYDLGWEHPTSGVLVVHLASAWFRSCPGD